MLFVFVIKLITNYLESLHYIKPKSNLSLIDTDCKRVKFILLERFFLPQARQLAFHLISYSDLLIAYSRMMFLKTEHKLYHLLHTQHT